MNRYGVWLGLSFRHAPVRIDDGVAVFGEEGVGVD